MTGNATFDVVDNVRGTHVSFPVDTSDRLIASVAISDDGSQLFDVEIGPSEPVLMSRSAVDGRELWSVVLDSPAGSFGTPLTVSADGHMTATVESGSLVLRNTSDGSRIRSLGHLDQIAPLALAFSPSGKSIAVVGGTTARAGPGPIPPPGAVDVTQAAFVLAPTDVESTSLTLRNIPGTSATAVAFAPDGNTLAIATVESSATISIFDATYGERLGSLGELSDKFESLAYTADGSEIVAASRQPGWMRWSATVEAWRNEACVIAGRNLTQEEWETFLAGEPYRQTCSGL